MLWKCTLIVLTIATVVGGTLVSAANVSVTIPSHGVVDYGPVNASVRIPCYGTINYDPGNLEEDVNDVRNNSSDLFEHLLL